MFFGRSLFDDSHHIGRQPHHLPHHWQQAATIISEVAVWIIVVAILVGLRLTSTELFSDESTLWLAGVILAFALLYYSVIQHNFDKKQRHYIKDIADVIFIGILSTLARDYSPYFFVLYILPIAGAAFALNILNSLLIATFASIFIAANIILNTHLFASVNPVYLGTIQILFLLLLTFFTRALAIQLRSEQSQRTVLEKKLRQADEKLEDVEAIEQEFVTTTTHQLNTPLSIIRGYSSLLLDEDAGKLNAKQRRYAREINDGSQRLANLIEDLLSIAHLDNRPQQQFDKLSTQSIIKEATDILSEKALAKDIKLKVKAPSTAAYVMGNKAQLIQAVANLVDNAIKYSDPKTSVTICVSREIVRHQRMVQITVSDHGIGIPKTEQGRIFQRFYRASNSRSRDTRGTGLGLYITKRVIDEHSGTIDFESSDKGTLFTITLPVAKR